MKINIKWNSIASKVSILVLAATFGLVTILISYSVLVLKDRELENAKTNAVSFAKDYSGRLKAVIEVPLDGVRALGSALLAVKDKRFDARLTRDEVNGMLSNFLAQNPGVLGAYTCGEPNAFDALDSLYKDKPGHDNTGRFIPYWVRTNSGIQLEPLVNYEVEGAGDYYVLAKRTRTETVLDPYYYPVAGKEILMMSLVTPINDGGKFLGITGADISLDRLQKMVEGDHQQIFQGNGELYIISNNGTIVASTLGSSIVGKPANTILKNFDSERTIISETNAIEEDILTVFVPLQIGQSKTPWQIAVTVPVSYLTTHAVEEMIKMILLSAFFLVFVSLGALFVLQRLIKPIGEIAGVAEDVALGNLELKKVKATSDEIQKLTTAFTKVINSQRDITEVCSAIASGDFSRKAEVKSNYDELAKSVNKMSASLQTAADEDARRNWSTEGLAKFGDILREDKALQTLAESILSNLVRYLKANQGGFFLVQSDAQGKSVSLELVACFAYDRKKFIQKNIAPGEGLVGQCYLEHQTTLLKEIPSGYIQITSGLGYAAPNCLLLVPLKHNDKIEGILELATFDSFEPYQIDFIEKLAQSIAATISNMKINERTRELLQQSQQQAEELKAQEEEMRQNIEEISATQEEMRRKEIEYTKRIHELENRSL